MLLTITIVKNFKTLRTLHRSYLFLFLCSEDVGNLGVLDLKEEIF